MSALLYCTPRAVLIQLLDSNSRPNIAKWIEKDEKCQIHYMKLFGFWLKSAWPERYNTIQRRRNFELDDFNEYSTGLCNSVIPLESSVDIRSAMITDLKIIRKSSEPRMVVNHFVGNRLYEFLIQLLLEQTHIDLIQWTDQENHQFQVLDISGIGKMYTKHQNIMTKSPSYCIKLLLSSYCMNGILIQIDKKNHTYQFNAAWYEEEMNRRVPNVVKISFEELIGRSIEKFPEITLGYTF